MPKRKIEQYEHKDQERVNNPPVGMVTPQTDPDTKKKKTYNHDPHIDPQLNWAGKKENSSFEVDTVSLHVHERIDPKTIIESVKKDTDEGGQLPLFQTKKPLREAIEFYKHKQAWSNRLIAGDSLLVMNSLIEKEGMEGRIQTVFIDPPYGISYGSNFQPFTNNRIVKDKNDNDLSSEPEMIKAFRDTWELGTHSYLSYMRDRIKLCHKLINESGSIFIQISDENLHFVRNILDEIFGAENFMSQINFQTKIPLGSKYLSNINDYLVWYSKDKSKVKFSKLFKKREIDSGSYPYIELENGEIKKFNPKKDSELLNDKNNKLFRILDLVSSGYGQSCYYDFEFNGEIIKAHSSGRSWKTHKEGMQNLIKKNRLVKYGKAFGYKLYFDDYPVSELHNTWNDTVNSFLKREYVVQTNPIVIKRCILMTSDPGDLVFDPTCGSGTTAFVAEDLGRRWITCDTSRVSLFIARKRLMTSTFNYYQLSYPEDGVQSGFVYNEIPHTTLGSIANNEIPKKEYLIDQPKIDKNKIRVSGPFTYEAVPSLTVKNFNESDKLDNTDDLTLGRSGETFNQSDWKDELLRTGIRVKSGDVIQFSRVETLKGTKYIQAEGQTKEDQPKKVFIVFGPKHAPLEQKVVELAWTEARSFKPDILLFCAFQFDEEAAKDIDELTPEIAGMQLLKVQMNTDLLTDGLRKKRSSNQSFWLVGHPDIKVHKCNDEKIKVEVLGFDYYNPKTGNIESGSKKNIAMWMLDADYDERCIYPSQIFFPLSGTSDGWIKLAKNLRAEIDLNKIETYNGTSSLEFEPGNQIAIKIIDDRGIESLKIIRM